MSLSVDIPPNELQTRISAESPYTDLGTLIVVTRSSKCFAQLSLPGCSLLTCQKVHVRYNIALRRFLPPNNVTGNEHIRTKLMAWKKATSGSSLADIKDDESPLSSKEKHEIVVATDGLNKVELGEYARAKGLHVEQIKSWRRMPSIASTKYESS